MASGSYRLWGSERAEQRTCIAVVVVIILLALIAFFIWGGVTGYFTSSSGAGFQSAFNLTFTPAAQTTVPGSNWVYLLNVHGDCVSLWSVSPSTGVWSDQASCTALASGGFVPRGLTTSSN